jgi:hypothetical protein
MSIKKGNYKCRISKEIHRCLYYNTTTTVAALFSVILILTGSVAGLPLLQQLQQAYASSQQVQEVLPSSVAPPQAPLLSPTQEQRPLTKCSHL